MRLPLTRRIGIAFILFGVALWTGTTHWLRPRSQIALDIPVSLSPGHIKTGEFLVNPDTLYFVDIETDLARRLPKRGCEPVSVLETKWDLASEGKSVESGSSPWEASGLTIGVFLSENTRYALDVEVLPGRLSEPE